MISPDSMRHEKDMKMKKKNGPQRKTNKSRQRITENNRTWYSPPHYNQAGIECIDAIRAATGDGYQYYLQGNIIKYLWRYRYKNGIEDLNKAKWYLDKLIEEMTDE